VGVALLSKMLFALIFVVTPLIELAILIYLGTVIGALYTILIVVITGLLEAFLARQGPYLKLVKGRGAQ
jgi:UPF0716 family protein affecting phage T7 exclusion